MERVYVIRAVGLRAKRKALGMTRAELSLLAGIPVGRLSAIEAGWEQAWADEHRTRLLRALDAEWTELFALQH
jgi:transcriptional regulator with XRE-family HTH domain